MTVILLIRRLFGNKRLNHLVQTCTKYYSLHNNKKEIGVIGIFTAVICGSLLWMQLTWFKKKISVVTDVFEVERGSSKYIYVDSPPEVAEEENKKVASVWNNVKQKWTETRVKVLPWFNTQIDNPKSLLRLAKSSNQGLRILGVYALAENKHWQEYQYRFIAQNSDIRTLIGLARCQGVDNRFFLPVPKPPPIKHYLEDEFRILLSSLSKDDIDKCVAYFTSTALHQGNISEERGGLWSFGGSGLEFAKSVSRVPEERVEIFCLEALDVHSAVKSHCEEIVKFGGLQLLEQLYEKRKNSIIIRRYIAKILGNLSVHESLHTHIARSGWVTLLAQWIKSVDLTLSLHAARALANLDRDFGPRVYQDGVYLIHPIHRSKEPVYVDIVFVHGLRGGPFKTWRQQDRKEPDANVQSDGNESVRLGTYTFCWPKDWLAKDCSHIRILSVEYDSELTTWNVKCPFESEKRTLQMRANKLKDKLKQADVGSRPVIWVGHSMGGLLIKEILKQAENDAKLHNMVKNTIGVVFYSTPHRGSSLAAFTNQASFILFPTVEVQEMSRDSLFLRTLQRNFQRLALDYDFSCISFGELEKMSIGAKLKLLVVPPDSSDPGIGQFYTLNTNHLNICKPWDRDSDVYKLTLSFIRKCIRNNQVEQLFKSGFSFPQMKKK